MNYTIAHIGINCENSEQAEKAALLFGLMTGSQLRNTEASVFAGTQFECLKQPGAGKNGHIAIAVDSVAEAISELEQKGFTFRKDTAKYTPEGVLRLIYLNEEISGFAVHLTLK